MQVQNYRSTGMVYEGSLPSAPALTEVKLETTGFANALRVVLALAARFFHQLEPGLFLPHERPDDCPWTGIGFRILERDLVVDRVGIKQSQAFGDMGSVRMEVSGVVKPVPTIEVGDIDHQRVSVPMSSRISIVQSDRVSERWTLGHVDDALHVVIFEKP